VREKYCTMADKSWLKPTSEQADFLAMVIPFNLHLKEYN